MKVQVRTITTNNDAALKQRIAKIRREFVNSGAEVPLIDPVSVVDRKTGQKAWTVEIFYVPGRLNREQTP